MSGQGPVRTPLRPAKNGGLVCLFSTGQLAPGLSPPGGVKMPQYLHPPTWESDCFLHICLLDLFINNILIPPPTPILLLPQLPTVHIKICRFDLELLDFNSEISAEFYRPAAVKEPTLLAWKSTSFPFWLREITSVIHMENLWRTFGDLFLAVSPTNTVTLSLGAVTTV